MPNFPIPSALRDHIRNRAAVHADKARDLALTGFPLTVQQIQDAVLDPETQSELRELVERKGIKTITKYNGIRLAFLRDNIPGLRRGIVLKLTLPKHIFVPRATLYGISTTDFNMDESHYLVPDLSGLESDVHETLMTWLSRALREERLYEIVQHITRKILDEDISPTMAHLRAFWPLLTTLVDPAVCNFPSDREKFAKWRDKLRNPPARMNKYQPSKLMLERWGPLMKAAEVQITTGMMLKGSTPRREDIVSEIEHWERITNDLRFPDALKL